MHTAHSFIQAPSGSGPDEEIQIELSTTSTGVVEELGGQLIQKAHLTVEDLVDIVLDPQRKDMANFRALLRLQVPIALESAPGSSAEVISNRSEVPALGMDILTLELPHSPQI